MTGESQPVPATQGIAVFAGTLNLDAPITVRATATGERTPLSECVRLIEAAATRRSRFVVLTDRMARRYAPTVHVTALATFLFWYFGRGVGIQPALLNAATVLIATCPCALALTVPAVQVIATSRRFRAGVLLKSPTALERLAGLDTGVFDKTGTLTEPTLGLANITEVEPSALRLAASLAVTSRHPSARSLAAAVGPVSAAEGVIEHPGEGLSRQTDAGETRLGSRAFCGDPSAPPSIGPELWLALPDAAPVCFPSMSGCGSMRDVVARLQRSAAAVRLVSGDRPESVARAAEALGLQDWQAGCSPVDKVATIEHLTARHSGLMVGGLNDSPSLAAATVSASPSLAADISQTVADVVFQGRSLAPIVAVIEIARHAKAVMRWNLALAIGYNALLVPLAMVGWVTPWLAAAAMSSSSLLVMANSFRVGRETVE